jgi:hypothetical protein
MADTVECELIITGPADVVEEMDRIVAGSFAFADFVPMPDGLVFDRPDRRNIPKLPDGWADPAWGYARRQIEAGVRQIPGGNNATDWMLRNWGQNRRCPQDFVRHEVQSEATRHYTFDTAWAAPLELMLGISGRFGAASLDLRYAGGTGEAGRAVFADGQIVLDDHWEGREAYDQLRVIGSKLDLDFDVEDQG